LDYIVQTLFVAIPQFLKQANQVKAPKTDESAAELFVSRQP